MQFSRRSEGDARRRNNFKGTVLLALNINDKNVTTNECKFIGHANKCIYISKLEIILGFP